jgi:hypothetical protein
MNNVRVEVRFQSVDASALGRKPTFIKSPGWEIGKLECSIEMQPNG